MKKILTILMLAAFSLLALPIAATATPPVAPVAPLTTTPTKPPLSSRFVPQSHIKRYKVNKKTIKLVNKAGVWAKSKKSRSVKHCESRGNYRAIGSGYYGAWQFDRGTWHSNGGGKYGTTANKAPRWAQDLIAYKTWKSRGWQPWTCA